MRAPSTASTVRRTSPATRAGTALAVIALAMLTPALAPALASATPSSGVTAEVLSAVTIPDVATVTLRHIAIAPAGTTGWHYHQGPVFALVTAGTLTRTLQDCTVVESVRGDIVEEAHGVDHPHSGRNDGAVPMELLTLYVEPVGAPLADDADAVDCP